MSNKKEKFIKQIKQNFEAEKNTKSYARVQRMAKTISENLYSEDSHFIYELIQNAQDNTYDTKHKKLEFFVYDDGILTKNNEVGFDESNIESICDFNDSTKSKKKALGYIGEKGIGFKSVFAITDQPSIHSNGYRFYFKKDEYIEPYWINNLDEYIKEFQDTKFTNIYLPYSDTFDNQKDIEKKIKDIEPILLLFLDNLDEINIYNKDSQILSVKKEIKVVNKNQNIVTIISTNEESKFVIYSKEINCSEGIKEDKRDGVKKRKLIIAFPLTAIEDTRLFAFLPTEIRTGLPFLIQADFLLTASRGDILKNKEWNKWILEEIVIFFIESFKNLQEIDKYQYLHYLDKSNSDYQFLNEYYQKILEQLKEEKIFLSIEEKFTTSSKICILDNYDFMYKYLQNVNYQNVNGNTFSYAHKEFYIPEHLIKTWNISTINANDFFRIIGNLFNIFAKKFNNNNILFEELLDYINNHHVEKKYLLKLPIIPFDEGDTIVFKTKVELENKLLFFRLDGKGVLNNVFSDLKIVSKKYQEKLQKIPFYTDIFEIKQPNILDILKSLDGHEEFFEDIENNINLLVYIKNNYLKDNQKEIIKLLLKHYQFLSKNNDLIKHDYNEASYKNKYTASFSTKLYISSEYLESTNSIEKIVNIYCDNQGKKNIDFISDQYLEYDQKLSKKDGEILKKEWRDFFQELQINDDIKLQETELEMWAYDSKHLQKQTSKSLKNIPFIATAIFSSYYNDKSNKLIHLDVNNLLQQDSIFLYQKLLKVHLTSSARDYMRVRGYYMKFRYDTVDSPWIDAIKNNYPIYVEDIKYKIQDVYLEVDDKLQKFFITLPKDYIQEENKNISEIFNIKDKPDLKSIVNLISNKKLTDFEDLKSIFSYLHFYHKNENIILEEIPIRQKNKIVYIPIGKLIWKNGKELNLLELESSYGSDFKKFFTEQMNIQEKPTIEQYIEYLTTNPKNYKIIFNKFIGNLYDILQSKKFPDLVNKKIFSVNKELLTYDEIIFNNENIETNELSNLFSVDQKIFSSFQEIVDKYRIKKISDYSRSIKIDSSTINENILEQYIKLLNFTWDYIFSTDQKKFNTLKKNKEFIVESKNISTGGYAEIILRLDVDKIFVDISQNIVLKDDTIYLSSSIEKRKEVTEISKYIASKVQIDFEKIERFYDKVYKVKEYNKYEYYKEGNIDEPKGEDKFDYVFEHILNEKFEEELFDGVEENKDMAEDSDDETKEKNTESTKSKKQGNNNSLNNQDQLSSVNQPIENQTQAKSSINNEKTIYPEYNIEVNSKNLKKHLCKVHHLNCDENNENAKNNQNSNTNDILNLAHAIDQHNKNIDTNDEEIDPSIIINEDEYRKSHQKRLEDNLNRSSQETKKRYASTKIKVGVQETREFLKKQYKGYCQICGFTFNQKDNQGKYFVSFDWLSEKITKQKTNINESGSSLCLCARCHSGIKYGDFEAKFLSKLQTIDLSKYTYDSFISHTNTKVESDKIPECYDFIEADMYKIPIRLLNEDKVIFYTEEHFLHFFNMLTLKEI